MPVSKGGRAAFMQQGLLEYLWYSSGPFGLFLVLLYLTLAVHGQDKRSNAGWRMYSHCIGMRIGAPDLVSCGDLLRWQLRVRGFRADCGGRM